MELLPEIETALLEKGVVVKRPVYEGESKRVDEEGEEEDEEESADGEKGGGKKNFEETSEEGE